jgi:Tfp pilus assembly protein PilF
MRGCAYGESKQFDKAIADLTEAIRLDPDRADAYASRAKAFRASGNEPRAAGDESKARALGR